MAKELTTRMRRRPLLAPLLIPMLGLLAAGAGIYWIGTWARTTVVVLVRHAEPAASNNGDPDLSAAGEARGYALERGVLAKHDADAIDQDLAVATVQVVDARQPRKLVVAQKPRIAVDLGRQDQTAVERLQDQIVLPVVQAR